MSDSVKQIECEAMKMAEAVNGGNWFIDYSEAAKEGWRLKVKWAMARYGNPPNE